MVEELQAAGIAALLAEPAETSHQRGPKKRAKTDKADARRLRELVTEGRVPLSWIPTEQACGRCCSSTATWPRERMACAQRIHATLVHHGVPSLAGRLADRPAHAGHAPRKRRHHALDDPHRRR